MKYDNYTQYGIHDRTERLFLSAYSATLFASSLLGDIFILIGSLRYNAIKLHRLTVVIIQYIALGDLLMTIFRALTETVSLAANKWLFGELYCRIGYFVFCAVGATLCLLITALSLTKLLIVKYPLRSISFPTKIAHFAALGFFILALAVTMMASIEQVDKIYFSYVTYNCEMDRSPAHVSWIAKIAFVISGSSLVVCIMLVIVSCVMLIAIAKRITDRGPGGLQWQGIMTVLLTAALFTAGALPIAVYLVAAYFTKEKSIWNIQFLRFAYTAASLNLLANFYIYTITVTSFRQFLKAKMRFLFALCFGNGVEVISETGERQNILAEN